MVERYMPDGTPPGIGPERSGPTSRGAIDSEIFEYMDPMSAPRPQDFYSRLLQDQLSQRFSDPSFVNAYRAATPEERTAMLGDLPDLAKDASYRFRDIVVQDALADTEENRKNAAEKLRIKRMIEQDSRDKATQAYLDRNPEVTKEILEGYKQGKYIKIVVDTQYGVPKEYYWENDPVKMVQKLRDYLNKVEDTITAEGRQTQQLLVQELFLSLPILMGDPGGRIERIDLENKLEGETNEQYQQRVRNATKPYNEFGKIMHEEFWRRFHLHQAYVGYYNAGDVNTAGQAIASMYAVQRNVLLKESNILYSKGDIGNWSKEALKKANLPIKRFYRIYDNKRGAFEFLSGDENEQEATRERWIKRVYRDMKVAGVYSEEDDEEFNQGKGVYIHLRSAQMEAERLWELDLRRHMHDVVKTTDETEISSSQQAKYLAMQGKLDYLSRARNGNFPTRRAASIKNRLYTQGRAMNFKLDLIDDVSFWNRDLLTVLPGELEGHIRTKLISIYNKKGYSKYLNKAQNDAIKITEAVFGLKKQDVNLEKGETGKWPETSDKDLEKWTWSEETYVDATGMAWVWEDFDEINDEEFLEFDRVNKIDKETRKRTINGFIEGEEVDPEVRDFVRGLKENGFVDYNYKLELPVSRVFRHLIPVEGVRSEFEGKPDAYLKGPTEEKLVGMDALLHYMSGERYDSLIHLTANLLRYREKNGILKGAFEASLDLAGIGSLLKWRDDDVKKLMNIVNQKVDMFKPGLANDIKLLLSYTGWSEFLLEFLKEILEGLLQQAVRGK